MKLFCELTRFQQDMATCFVYEQLMLGTITGELPINDASIYTIPVKREVHKILKKAYDMGASETEIIQAFEQSSIIRMHLTAVARSKAIQAFYQEPGDLVFREPLDKHESHFVDRKIDEDDDD